MGKCYYLYRGDSFRNGLNLTVFRVVPINDKTKLLFVYIDRLCDTKPLDEMMLNPVRSSDKKCEVFIFEEFVANQLRAVAQIKSTKNVNELINGILTANVAVLVEGETNALLADLIGFEKQSIEEPSSETVIRCPRGRVYRNITCEYMLNPKTN